MAVVLWSRADRKIFLPSAGPRKVGCGISRGVGKLGAFVWDSETVNYIALLPCSRSDNVAYSYLAYLGAHVTILSLAFGTFTQQLISYRMSPIPASQADLLPGNIPRAETWQEFTGNPAEGGT
jgi:hypothetical protein